MLVLATPQLSKSISCLLLNAVGWVDSLCGICGAYSSAEKGFSQSRRIFPSFVIAPAFHSHTFIVRGPDRLQFQETQCHQNKV